MSILCTLYLKDGIILASESRATHSNINNGEKIITGLTDDLQKTFSIDDKNIGISFCANARVGNMVMDDFFQMFIKDHVKADYTIEIISEILRGFFKDRGTQIILAGYENNIPYVYKIADGAKELLNRRGTETIYGMEVRGLYEKACEHFEQEIQPHIVFGNLTIEEGVSLAKELIGYAINTETCCGGDINILVIKPNSIIWHQNTHHIPPILPSEGIPTENQISTEDSLPTEE